ncbi:MAG: LysM peptidoglycan-binding domain-containing protein [Actinomycetota bacterium]
MAVRVEELRVGTLEARIYRFPAVRARRRRAVIARRRLTVVAVLITLVVAFMLATGPSGVAPASVGRAPKGVVVQPGQTLWDIGGRYARTGADPRAYVQAILELNHLDAPPPAGTRIRLPR